MNGGNAFRFGLVTGRVCWGVNKMDIKWTRIKREVDVLFCRVEVVVL